MGAMRKRLSTYILSAFCALGISIQSNIAYAIPITITTDAELVAAYGSLPTEEDNFVRALTLSSEISGSSDILVTLFQVLKEAINQQSSDIAFWMNKLKDMNDIADAMSDYLQGLVDDSSELRDKLRDSSITLLGIDPDLEATGPNLLFALYDNDSDQPISVVGDVSSDDIGSVNALILSYGVPLTYAKSVPEPATLALLTSGLIGLAWMGRKKKRSQ